MPRHDALMTWDPVSRALAGARRSGLFDGARPVAIARAPGRLDVMGGIADYSGSLVCEMPLGVAVAAVVQGRDDGQIVCHSAQKRRTVRLEAAALATPDPLEMRQRLAGSSSWARYVIGCWWWLQQNHRPSTGPQGVTLYVDSDIPAGAAVSSSAALEVATMSAGAALARIQLKPIDLAAACQFVENRVVGAPCGVMDQITAALGQQGKMLRILCQPTDEGHPADLLGWIDVPRGYAVVGVYSGITHDVAGIPYTKARVAAFMGQKILSTLQTPDLTCGWLARVDAVEYRRKWQAQLPITMTGREFLRRYQATNDPVTTAQPETAYAVRGGTDHGIFEMERVSAFAGLLQGAHRRADLRDRMTQAGELMYASHASYSQCAHLGHLLTDRLVNMVRRFGPAKGFFGAKITGGGSGGTVAILLRDDARCYDTLGALRRRYERETGKKTLLLVGTSPGSAKLGVVTMKLGAAGS